MTVTVNRRMTFPSGRLDSGPPARPPQTGYARGGRLVRRNPSAPRAPVCGRPRTGATPVSRRQHVLIARIKTPLLVSLCVAAAVAALPAAAEAKSKCNSKNSTTLASDKYVRVFGKNGKAVACYKPSGKRTKLAGALPTTDLF